MNKEKSDISRRISKYEAGLKVLEEELQIKPSISLEFPNFRVLPEEVRLALLVLEKNKYQFMRAYEDLKKNNG